MPSRNSLGELELLVLLALLRLGEGAYGAGIRDEIRERTGRRVTPGAIYPTLDRLERKGLVRSYAGAPVPERGGRSKRHFVIERAGLAELRRTWGQYAALADGIERALRLGRAR
jgi:DNA-binding PadR family transcriptional regulator